jgi:hypothetical protein
MLSSSQLIYHKQLFWMLFAMQVEMTYAAVPTPPTPHTTSDGLTVFSVESFGGGRAQSEIAGQFGERRRYSKSQCDK